MTAEDDRKSDLSELEELIGYRFDTIALLETALTHSSFVNENQGLGCSDNERMEFLGDAVLQLCISELLFTKFPAAHEGNLSKIRASLVTEQPLAEVARFFQTGKWLLLGKGEGASGGREKSSILANAFEAVIASIFLDGGYEKINAVVRSIFGPLIEKSIDDLPLYRDTKSLLQEFCQARYKLIPQYVLVEEFGPDHDKTFEIEVVIGTAIRKRGIGKSKKEAEQKAATRALDELMHD